MSDPTPHVHHAIDYIELTIRDPAEAKAFYGAAFGWRFTDYGPDYVGIQAVGREGEMGGLTRGTTHPGGPLVVLFSTDLDRTCEAVASAGGAIVKPPFPFPGGRRFHFADPSGNVLGVWSPR
jgi:predicted enzyme related to lactoylglutathione lyase